jgi:hypothetical protein
LINFISCWAPFLRHGVDAPRPTQAASPILAFGETLPDFTLTCVKPGFMRHEENGESAFETLTPESFPANGR